MPTYLWILTGILVLLTLLLYIPVRLRVEADRDGLRLTAGYLFFRFPLPIGEEVEKAVEELPPEPQKELPRKAARKLGVPVSDILDTLARIWPPVRRLLRSVKLTRVQLYLTVGGEDAAAVALNFGRICAAVASGEALLRNLFKRVDIRALSVEPDFFTQRFAYTLDLTLGLRPLRVLYTAGVVLIKALPLLLRILRPGRAGAAKAQPQADAPGAEAPSTP